MKHPWCRCRRWPLQRNLFMYFNPCLQLLHCVLVFSATGNLRGAGNVLAQAAFLLIIQEIFANLQQFLPGHSCYNFLASFVESRWAIVCRKSNQRVPFDCQGALGAYIYMAISCVYKWQMLCRMHGMTWPKAASSFNFSGVLSQDTTGSKV